MRKLGTEKHPSCIEHDGSDTFDGEPIVTADAAYTMAHAYHLTAMGQTEDELQRGMILLRIGRIGLYAPLTIEMMRALAQQVTLMADIIEGNAARKAADALARAGKRGGGMTLRRPVAALRAIWATDSWNPETRRVALVSRQGLQALLLTGPAIAMLGLALGLTP